MIIFQISIVLVLLITYTHQYIYDIDDYIPIYNERLHHFYESVIEFDIKSYYLIISNLKIICNKYSFSKTSFRFSYEKVLYSFSFNMLIRHHNGLTINRNNLIIEHTFKSIVFKIVNYKAFVVVFDNDSSKCTYYLQDLISHPIFASIVEATQRICKLVSDLIEDKINSFTKRMPMNEAAFNFENLIDRLI